MKGWPGLIVVTYLLLFLLLSAPLAIVCFMPERVFSRTGDPEFLLGSWIVAAVLAGAAGLLLIVPVNLARRRPVSRQGLLVPVITSGMLTALLVYAGGGSIILAIWGDHPGEWTAWLPLPILWAGWAWVFRVYSRVREPRTLVARLMRALFRGSILELLVAIPCHVIVRGRNDCCAPMGTFLGIATGIAVMLLSMGPGVFFLYARRVRDLRRAQQEPTAASD